MLDRIYVEIGNVCNLSCSFCPSTTRTPRQMTAAEFKTVCQRIRGFTRTVYFHVMGEPLCHPLLGLFLDIASAHELRVCITTNGTLLDECKDVLLSRAHVLHKISISLHCIEGNGQSEELVNYLDSCLTFAREAASAGVYTVLRLWNMDSEAGEGKNEENAYIHQRLHEAFPTEWVKRWSGFRVADRIFLEYAGVFTWPSESTAKQRERGFCHGMLDQLAILCDGTVVPCCLDHNGDIALGNIFLDELDAILQSDRALHLKEGLEKGILTEALCRSCTYAQRFHKERKS